MGNCIEQSAPVQQTNKQQLIYNCCQSKETIKDFENNIKEIYDVNLKDIIDLETQQKIENLNYDKSILKSLKSPYKTSQRVYYLKNESLIYQGELKKGQWVGIGKQLDSEGNFFEGVFVNGAQLGPGWLLKKTGSILEGHFQTDNYIKNALYTDRDKNVYKGDLKEQQANGLGFQIFLNSNQKWTYKGAFINGKKNGKGMLKFQNGNIYIGDFQDDQIHGQGAFYYKNGNLYEGYFINGKKNGSGIMRLKDGSFYQGFFKDNKKMGPGIVGKNVLIYFKGEIGDQNTVES